MSEGCPKGYYWDGTKCRKSIVIKRHGIYGKGFESESQQQQYAKIKQVERTEPPTLVDEQMAALNAFTAHSSPEVHRKIQNDLKYAETFKKANKSKHEDEDRKAREMENRIFSSGKASCPPGYHWVDIHSSHDKYGKIVSVIGHCAKNPRRRK